MKLRNLIFALFLAIGAIGFTACTGDDGAQGPPGPQGPKGDPGDPGDDAGSMESNYPFLKTWGKANGRIACDDPLLTEAGMFPGPALEALPATTNAVRYAPAAGDADTANGYVHVACASSIFDAVGNPNVDGVMGGDLTGAGVVTDSATTGNQNAALIFVKTHRGGDKNPVPQEGGRAPVPNGLNGESSTVQKTFTSGVFFANMDGRAVGEAAGRYDLYSDCDQGAGTVPPALKGEWRAVHIEEKTWSTNLASGFVAAVADTGITKTTKKVCLSLDSLPGAVKCYVREEMAADAATPAANSPAALVTASMTEKIIIYGDGTDSMVVDPMAAAATHATNAGRLGPADAADLSGAEGVQFVGNANDFQGAKLCNLFSEAAPAQP